MGIMIDWIRIFPVQEKVTHPSVRQRMRLVFGALAVFGLVAVPSWSFGLRLWTARAQGNRLSLHRSCANCCSNIYADSH